MSGALTGENRWYLEEMQERWSADPSSVSPEWQALFAGDSMPAPRPGAGASQPGLSKPARSSDAGGAVGGSPLFRLLSPEDMAAMEACGEEQELRDGETLFRAGDRATDLYIVQKGTLVLSHTERVVLLVGAGEVVGEIAILSPDKRRSLDVVARGPVCLLRISGQAFQELMQERPALVRALLAVLSERVRNSTASQERVDMLVRVYRVRGHVMARLNPLGPAEESHPELSIEYHGLTEADLDRSFSTRIFGEGVSLRSLREIVAHLKETYCGHIGIQYMHIDDLEVQRWLEHRMESVGYAKGLDRSTQERILARLTDAEVFEQFLHRKFQGAKRFSLEGGESLIPLLDLAIEQAGEYGVEEIVIGMAHRGRLNVMANILQKEPALIFREFADLDPGLYLGCGDVKYHLGHSHDWDTVSGQTVHLTLCCNPSHLEFIGPVVAGRVRAKQHRRGDHQRTAVLPLVIHGDSAMAGEGVVQELLNMSQLDGYAVGGTVHVVLNNQIGFTTTPEKARSTRYCTEVARMLQIPILHVNGEHPEAVAWTIQLALEFRRAFHRDVVIDMYCYRRYGHNEGDEPAFTQPLMTKAIKARKSVREAYLEDILRLGGVSQAQADELVATSKGRLEAALKRARAEDFEYEVGSSGQGLWANFVGGADSAVPRADTGMESTEAAALLRGLCQVPTGFHPHRKVQRLLNARMEMAEGQRPLDWGAAEALALASLLNEGSHIRLSGQDAGRGTFSHRHAVLRDQQTGGEYTPLKQLKGDFEVWDSPLTETGVLGFDYGYSLDYPDGVVIWEAQFGDFTNVAQVIIDQFISSAEDKWRRLTGLVMLLPHGFEGQGPEHSSARLERFLTLAAEDNMQIVNLTSPAQIFHVLRRQRLRPLRKPLIVMSPKSLLRHPAAVSSLSDLTEGRFCRVLPNVGSAPSWKVRRIVVCTGKLYYEIADRRASEERSDVAVVRLEQIYPFPGEELAEALSEYPSGLPLVWVQEEPKNMGVWPFLRARFGDELCGRPLQCLSRPESASPATGSAAAHRKEQTLLIDQVFDLGS